MAKPTKDKIAKMKTFHLKKECTKAGIEFENKEQAVKDLTAHHHGDEEKSKKGGKVKGKIKGQGKKTAPPKHGDLEDAELGEIGARLMVLEAEVKALSTSVAKSFEEVEAALSDDDDDKSSTSDDDDEATAEAKKILKAYITNDELDITEEQIRKLKKTGIQALATLLGLEPDALPSAIPKAKKLLVEKWKEMKDDDGDDDDGDDEFVNGPDEERAQKISSDNGLSKKFWKKNKERPIYVHLADGAWQQAEVKSCGESEEEKGEMCVKVTYDDGETGEVFYFEPDDDDSETYFVAGFVADEE